MGDLTNNFSRHEMACKCGCGYDTMDWETLQQAQSICNHFADVLGVPKVVVDVHSAARCETHNRAVGGAKNSQHLFGRAIDFSIRGVLAADLYAYAVTRYPGRFGLGQYPTFLHLDTASGGERRW